MQKKNRQSGFTLIELMIVMAIIGILAVIAVPSYISAVRQAREAVLKEDLHVLRNAIDKPFGKPLLRTLRGLGWQIVESA